MHKIFELKEMELEQLRLLASELEVKGFKRMEKDDLVYAIIDAEAVKSAQNAPEKPAKRRGRPKKEDKQQTPDATKEAKPSACSRRRTMARAGRAPMAARYSPFVCATAQAITGKSVRWLRMEV